MGRGFRPKPRVLIVDDDPGTLATFSAMLCLEGIAATGASTGAAALALTSALQFDLVLADRCLEDMEGTDILQQLRVRGLAIPFVLMTGFPTDDSERVAQQLGAAAYVRKPIWYDDLLAIVRTCVEHATDPTAPREPGAYPSPVLLRAIALMEQRFREKDLTSRIAANALDITQEHLCRLFRRGRRHTFGVELRSIRIRKAEWLLKHTAKSMKEIADAVGFHNTSELAHGFAAVHGVTPTEFRRTSS